jgi:hypothetical protein
MMMQLMAASYQAATAEPAAEQEAAEVASAASSSYQAASATHTAEQAAESDVATTDGLKRATASLYRCLQL